MSTLTTYEVHTLKNGRWLIAAVHNEKAMALNEAREITGNRFFDGVKVMAELFDQNSGNTYARVLFNHDRTRKTGEPARQQTQRRNRPQHRNRSQRRPAAYQAKLAGEEKTAGQSSFMSTMMLLMLVMGSMASVLVAMSMFVK